ncbi:hypothetical protein CBW65_10290 [Tumebacillus avium]|uniref:Uncharacterized protein n=1 Tax=Tumebacillus avium TaxID=1903704 RepID=A0A1Y0IPC7_9BACL|nr:hypothetical protein CBW65_10290 [Tumebacillus avium]
MSIKKKLNTFWSIMLSFVMVFLLSAQPHAVLAAGGDETAVQETRGTSLSNNASVTENAEEPEVLPLVLAPVAASALSSTVINSIFAVCLGWYVGATSQNLFKASINDKEAYTFESYTVVTTDKYYPSFPDFMEVTTTRSAVKHMDQSIVLETHKRIRDWSNNNNYRAYSSTPFPGNVMYVIDINSSLTGTVNRHLGNSLYGTKVNPGFANESGFDLAGYSLFIISNKDTEEIFHAHFMPQWLRDREIEYMRYKGQFDIQTHPVKTENDKYLKRDANYSWNFNSAMTNRGLLYDTYTKKYSIVPYK